MDKNVVFYPLTYPQKSIWYTEKMFPGTSISNVAGSFRIKSRIDYELLEKAINLLLEKNNALRFRILDGEEPRQYIKAYTYQKIDFIDFSKYDDPLSELFKWEEHQTKIPFELFDSQLVYFAIIKISEEEGGYYFKTHHTISDAWTMSLIVNQMLKYYYSLKSGIQIPCEELPSYTDYIESETEYINSKRFLKDREYWNNKFETLPELTTLKTRVTSQTATKARRKTFVAPEKFSKKLREYCMENNVSPYVLFMSALCMYIYRISSKDEAVVGTPILNRSNIKEKNTMGMFINTSLLRVKIDGSANFKEFSEYISRECMSLLRHQKYPYDLLLKEVRKKFKTTSNLYDIVLSYQNNKLDSGRDGEQYRARWHSNGHQTNSLTISINDREGEGSFIIDYDFHEDIYYIKEIEFIHKHIISLLWHAIDNPARPICRIEMLTEAEKHKILYEFNDTDADYPKDKTIHELFEEQAARTPDSIALVFEDKEITYRELNNKSNQLARVLRGKGIKPDGIAALMVNRSLEMIIAIIAILKAGGAFLPIDPQYPEERVRFMLEDSSASILLTQRDIRNKAVFANEIIEVDDPEIYLAAPEESIANINKPSDLAYVIYTSGSTGMPKGTMIEHKSVVNFSYGVSKIMLFSPGISILSITTISFDIFIFEVLPSLLKGLKVVITNNEQMMIPKKIIELICKYKIDKIYGTPSRIQALIDAGSKDSLKSLKEVMVGGEVFPLKLFRQLREVTDAQILNGYGPTETTIGVVFNRLSTNLNTNTIPIGKPISNTKIYILDSHLNPVPIGISGELYIGGDGVGRGYLNKPELTSEKFIASPFVPGERIYSSGDIARWYSQGDIGYLGRMDNQVKIRGYRIELGEIENKLSGINGIKNAVIAVNKDDMNNNCLCAYFTADSEISVQDIRAKLLQQLPNYMIPSYFIKMDQLPFTSSGKIDIKRLPEPDITQLIEAQYVAPGNEIEEKLARLWEEVLGIQRIGVDHNFFELGGDSLQAIKLQVKLLENGWTIKTQDFYKHSTIRQLAERIINIKDNAAGQEEIVENLEDCREDEVDAARVSGEKWNWKSVLLIGATGFLGIHILDYLLDNTDADIYCLIRSSNSGEARKKLYDLLKFYFSGKHDNAVGKRVFAVKGNIEYKNMGLEEDRYCELGGRIEAVIHTAALVKYYGEYSQFERVNVLGTENVIKFAAGFGKPLYYISTMGISGQRSKEQNLLKSVFTERDLHIGQDYSANLYLRSKFEAEKLIKKYTCNGLKAAIFRVGNLTGRYTDGLFQKNIEENYFYNVLKSIIEIGAVSSNILNSVFEFTPIDFCSKAVVELSMLKEAVGRTFHIYNSNTLNVSDLLGLLRELEININVLDKDSFKGLILEMAASKSDSTKIRGIINDLDDSSQLDFKVNVKVSSEITLGFLNKTGFEWPRIDKLYLNKVIKYMKEIKYLDNF